MVYLTGICENCDEVLIVIKAESTFITWVTKKLYKECGICYLDETDLLSIINLEHDGYITIFWQMNNQSKRNMLLFLIFRAEPYSERCRSYHGEGRWWNVYRVPLECDSRVRQSEAHSRVTESELNFFILRKIPSFELENNRSKFLHREWVNKKIFTVDTNYSRAMSVVSSRIQSQNWCSSFEGI